MSSENFVIDVAVNGGRIIFRDNGLLHNLETGAEKTIRAAYITAQRTAPEVENYMKENAPWTDRTGNARSGLHAQAYKEGDEIGIVLYGSVAYQIYLETRFSGAYAIIDPTIDAMSPVVMARFNRLLERI